MTWLVDYLSVWVGRREGLPGPQYRSEGYRLEEIVSFLAMIIAACAKYVLGPTGI